MTKREQRNDERLRDLRRRLGICHPPIGLLNNPRPLTSTERAIRKQMQGE